jgi:uncharacterized membrane protein
MMDKELTLWFMVGLSAVGAATYFGRQNNLFLTLIFSAIFFLCIHICFQYDKRIK